VSSVAIASIAFACIFGGILLGMFLRTALPEHHLSSDTKDVVRVASALVGTMAALVLGLLISTAKNAYDTRNSELAQVSADIVLLDSMLRHYGPETKDIRSLPRLSVATTIERIWSANGARDAGIDAPISPAETLYDKIGELQPSSEYQRSLQTQALAMMIGIGNTRFLLIQQIDSTIHPAFLAVLVFWLTIIFASFGLFGPRNATVMAVLLVCALSAASAIFLILDLDQAFTGTFQTSSAPLRQALAHLGP
jgi:hypothetical protein